MRWVQGSGKRTHKLFHANYRDFIIRFINWWCDSGCVTYGVNATNEIYYSIFCCCCFGDWTLALTDKQINWIKNISFPLFSLLRFFVVFCCSYRLLIIMHSISDINSRALGTIRSIDCSAGNPSHNRINNNITLAWTAPLSTSLVRTNINLS